MYLQDSLSSPTWPRTSTYFTISRDLTIKNPMNVSFTFNHQEITKQELSKGKFYCNSSFVHQIFFFFFRWFLVWAIWCTIHQILHFMRLHNDIGLLSTSIHFHFPAHPRKTISYCLDLWGKYCILVCILFLVCSIHNGYHPHL